MHGTMVLILLLALVPTLLQLFAINLYCQRMAKVVRRAADKPPYTTAVEIAELGPEPQAVARLLDRATRLDPDEIDGLIDARGGRLPLPMSRPAAMSLLRDLRNLGAVADVIYSQAPEPQRR